MTTKLIPARYYGDTANHTDLVLVQLTVLVLLLPLLPEGDDDEAHEDVHHEEGDDDDVDDEEDGDLHAVVVDWTRVLPVRIDGLVQQAGDRQTDRSQLDRHG